MAVPNVSASKCVYTRFSFARDARCSSIQLGEAAKYYYIYVFEGTFSLQRMIRAGNVFLLDITLSIHSHTHAHRVDWERVSLNLNTKIYICRMRLLSTNNRLLAFAPVFQRFLRFFPWAHRHNKEKPTIFWRQTTAIGAVAQLAIIPPRTYTQVCTDKHALI